MLLALATLLPMLAQEVEVVSRQRLLEGVEGPAYYPVLNATGDRLLRVTAAILEDIFQPASTQNLCARVGGDEFLVVVRGEDLSRIESLCTAVRHQLESLAGKDGFPKDTSIS